MFIIDILLHFWSYIWLFFMYIYKLIEIILLFMSIAGLIYGLYCTYLTEMEKKPKNKKQKIDIFKKYYETESSQTVQSRFSALV